MHCRLATCAAAKVREAKSASRALSVPILDDRSTAKRRETTANDRLLHFMAQLPLGRKRRRVWNDEPAIVLMKSVVAWSSPKANDCAERSLQDYSRARLYELRLAGPRFRGQEKIPRAVWAAWDHRSGKQPGLLATVTRRFLRIVAIGCHSTCPTESTTAVGIVLAFATYRITSHSDLFSSGHRT